jgi:hypothetical protein
MWALHETSHLGRLFLSISIVTSKNTQRNPLNEILAQQAHFTFGPCQSTVKHSLHNLKTELYLFPQNDIYYKNKYSI